MGYDWSKFKRKLYIKAPLKEVFDAWVTPKGIIMWFIKEAIYTSPTGQIREVEEYPQEKDEYYWKWHQDLEAKGKVLKIIPNERFEFTFGKKHANSDEDVIVTIDFGFENDETWFILTQSNMGGDLKDNALYHLSCNLGWSFFMANMKAYFHHGIDLREYESHRAYETRAISL